MKPILFETVNEDDLPVLAEILNYYIEHTTVSFHTTSLSPEDMREKLFFDHPAYRSFTIREDGILIGYSSISPWKKQQAYRHTGEISIYLSPEFTGRGIGSRAIAFLTDHAMQNGIQNLIAGLCSENTTSKRLFEKNGFLQCAHFRAVGNKFGRVLDTVYLQRIL